MPQHQSATQPQSKADEWPELLAEIKQVDPALAIIVGNLAQADGIQTVARWLHKNKLGNPVELLDAQDYQRERQQTLKAITPELARMGRADLVVRLKRFMVADPDHAQTAPPPPPVWLWPKLPERLQRLAKALIEAGGCMGSDDLKAQIKFDPSRVHCPEYAKWRPWVDTYIGKEMRGVYVWLPMQSAESKQPHNLHVKET